jgi:hypothetical protein
MCTDNSLQDITDWVIPMTTYTSQAEPCSCETTHCDTSTYDPCQEQCVPEFDENENFIGLNCPPPCPETSTNCYLVLGNPLHGGGWAGRGCCLTGEYCWASNYYGGFGVPCNETEQNINTPASWWNYCHAEAPNGSVDDMPTLNCDTPSP